MLQIRKMKNTEIEQNQNQYYKNDSMYKALN